MPIKVAVLFGGRSGEHEVSLRSARSVAAALGPRHEPVLVLLDRKGRWWLQPGESPEAEGGTPAFLAPDPEDRGRLRRMADAAVLAEPDVYFPVMHGTYGEDGTVQGLLELAGVPYVGPGVAASAVGMDKALMKAVFGAAGLPQVDYRVLRAPGEATAAAAAMRWPIFVKPANLGSSVGISKADGPDALAPAVAAAFAYDTKVLLEQGVPVREIECAVLGNEEPRASVPGEVVPDREFYDYDSKYSATSRTELRIPAPLPPGTAEEVRRLAVAAFQAVDGAGCARIDFFLEKDSGRLLLNEINTIPGFTSISMYPKLWEASGMPYPDLLARLVELARDRHRRRGRLRTDLGA